MSLDNLIKKLGVIDVVNVAVGLEKEIAKRKKQGEFNDIVLSDFDLSRRLEIALRDANMVHLSDVLSTTRGNLMKTRNFGKKSLEELEMIMKVMGLKIPF